MKSMVIMILLCCNALIANADAGKKEVRIDAEKIDSLVHDYFISQYQKEKSALYENLSRPGRPPNCDPHKPPADSSHCMDVMCEKLGTFGCDTQSEIAEVGAACRGVEVSCVQSTCDRLGMFGCDTISELREVGGVCRSVFDGRCVDVVCEKLGMFGCDTMSEIAQVGSMCRGRVDSGCIENVCERLGMFGCDTMSELQQVAKTCGGK